MANKINLFFPKKKRYYVLIITSCCAAAFIEWRKKIESFTKDVLTTEIQFTSTQNKHKISTLLN